MQLLDFCIKKFVLQLRKIQKWEKKRNYKNYKEKSRQQND